MKPKPPPDAHRRALSRLMRAGLAKVRPEAARLLSEHGEWLHLVSWTYYFYGAHRDVGLDIPGVERLLESPEPSEEDIREIDSLARRLSRWWHVAGDALPLLGRLIARPEMRLTMAEAHRYLHNRRGVASYIRSMLKTPLLQARREHQPVLLIGHSLGSVIAYDTLWELSHEDNVDLRIDLFITLGSPLATRFMRKGLRGADRSGRERFPTNIRRWANFSAKGELTALHPRLQPTFQEMIDLGLLESLDDHTGLYNPFRGELGLNVHNAYGYLVNPAVAEVVGDWLEEHARAAASI